MPSAEPPTPVLMARLKWDTMRVDGARFREGQEFVVLREFDARGDDGDHKCLSLGNSEGTYMIPCIEKRDVELFIGHPKCH